MKSQRETAKWGMKLVTTLFLLLPFLASAQYTPIVGIPGVSGGDFSSYINSVYALSISIAALLAVIKIIIAGVKWMMTDIVTSKSDAKRDIQGALLGLLIVLSAVLILSIINSDLASGGVGGSSGSSFTTQNGATQAAPSRPAYMVNSASGYTWISTDENYPNQRDFQDNCTTAGNSIYWSFDTSQIRCQAPTAAQDAAIRALAPTGGSFSTADQDNFVQAYVDYVLPAEVNAAGLSAIETNLESSLGEDWDVHFAIDTASASILEQTQFEGVCEDVDQALGTDGYTGYERVTTGGVTYLACVTQNL